MNLLSLLAIVLGCFLGTVAGAGLSVFLEAWQAARRRRRFAREWREAMDRDSSSENKNSDGC